MTTNGDFTEIPIVDLAPWRGDAAAKAAFADELRDICHNVGFFVLTGHGIDPAMVDNVFSTSEAFFALPEEQKRLIDKRQSRHFRGWEPVGAEYTNNRPDMREQIDLWSEHTPRPGRFGAALPAPARSQPVAAGGRRPRLPHRARPLVPGARRAGG